MTAEEMAASLTDSVYSTDSLDEPVGGNLPRPGGGSTALLGGLNRQCGDLIIQLNVMLSEKCEGDGRGQWSDNFCIFFFYSVIFF